MFVVYTYESEGGRASDFDEARAEFETLADARDEVKRRLGDLDTSRLWDGFEPDDSPLVPVEAYHDSPDEGCGGVQISEQR